MTTPEYRIARLAPAPPRSAHIPAGSGPPPCPFPLNGPDKSGDGSAGRDRRHVVRIQFRTKARQISQIRQCIVALHENKARDRKSTEEFSCLAPVMYG